MNLPFKIAFMIAFLFVVLSSCIKEISAVPALQQTVPPGDVAVCPLSTVQYTCVADNELRWKENAPGTPQAVTYDLNREINQTAMTGVFNTILTDISGNTLTSTATIDSVSLGDDGRSITCRDVTGSANQQNLTVQVAGVPLAPSNVAIGGILSSTGSELTVNLTWSNSRCVVVYYVEVTAATNTTSITNTTSQYIILPLQIGVVYSFRVRGADSINRLGKWSDYFVYAPNVSVLTTAPPSPTATASSELLGLSGGTIAGIVIGVIGFIVILVGIIILATVHYYKKIKPRDVKAKNGTNEDLEKDKKANKAAGIPDNLNYIVIEQPGESETTKGKKPKDNHKVLYSEVKASDAPKQGATNQTQNAAPKQGATNQTQNAAPKQGATNQTQNAVPKQGATNQTQNAAPKQGATNQTQDAAPMQDATNQTQDASPMQMQDDVSESLPTYAQANTKQGFVASLHN